VLGPAHITNSSNNFSSSQIGAMDGENMGTAFGDHATLHVMATFPSSQATLFRPAQANICKGPPTNFSDWQLGKFAAEAELTAEASYSSSSTTLFSPALISNISYNNNLSDRRIRNFAGEATLTAEVGSCSSTSYSCSSETISKSEGR
jgi:hypothetical protein